jgi:hypothetical protein
MHAANIIKPCGEKYFKKGAAKAAPVCIEQRLAWHYSIFKPFGAAIGQPTDGRLM